MALFDVLPDLDNLRQEDIDATINYLRREVTRVADEFLWEKFSSDNSDRGIEAEIEWGGEVIPLRIKRALTIDERQRANDAAFRIDIDEKGRPTIGKQDQAAYTKEIVLIGLKYWPFEYHAGAPVPISRKTVSEMDGALLDKIATRILNATEVDKKKLDPFESQSGEDSSKAELPDQN